MYLKINRSVLRWCALLVALFTSNLSHAAVSVDSYGWTQITPSADSLIVYVSNSEGDDANDGLSPSTPKKTILAADALIRDGYPDHLLLKRGDVFPVETSVLLGRWKNGRSADEPLVMSYYGASGERPVVKILKKFIDWNGQARDYQAFVGLDIYKSNSDPFSPDYTNSNCEEVLRFVGGGADLLIEDCKIRFGMTTVISYGGNLVTDVRIRRNIILDAWVNNTSNSHDKIQGLFMGGDVDGSYLVEENFFDHNGWSEDVPGAGANKYNHNVYINCDIVEGGIIRGNISARGAAHGIQARSGGLVDRNLFIQNAVALNVGGHCLPTYPGVVTFPNRAWQNVVLSGRFMDMDNIENNYNNNYLRSAAIWGIDGGGGKIEGVLVEDNVVANRIADGTNRSYLDLDSGVFVNNVSHNWDPALDTFDPSWPHPDDDAGDYFASIGGTDSTLDYLDWLRNRPLGVLPWQMTAYSAINYIREGFNRAPVSGYYLYDGTTIVNVTGVDVSPSSATIQGIDTLQLSETVTPSDATNKNVVWSSSDTSVAVVDPNGLVSSVAPGTAVVTATTNDGGFTDTAIITVAAVSPSGVSVVPGMAEIAIGQVLELTEVVAPANATNKDVTWSSADSSIATVDADGAITGIALGSTTISATTVQGGHVGSSSVLVSPTAPVPASTYQAEEYDAISDAQVSAAFLGFNGSGFVDYGGNGAWVEWQTVDAGPLGGLVNAELRYANGSAGNRQCSVSVNGQFVQNVDFASTGTWNDWGTEPLFLSLSAGLNTVRVTAITGSGGPNLDELSIAGSGTLEPVTGVSLSPAGGTVSEGDSLQLTATISPANASNQGVSWSSNDASVATVSANGVVTGVAAGSATITVTTSDGGFTDTSLITVVSSNVAVTGVDLTPSAVSIVEGDTVQLTAGVLPANATNQAVSWSTSDATVATVDANGLVSGVAAGTANITVTTSDGGFTDSTAVTVNAVTPVPTIVYQAEALSASSGGSVKTHTSGYNGSGFFDFGGNGSWMEWNDINGGASGGTATLAFRYGNGGATDRRCELTVNGNVIQNVDFAPGGAWTDWVLVEVEVTLQSGNNTVRLTANTSSGGPNLDEVEVDDLGSTVILVTGVTVQPDLILTVGEAEYMTATIAPAEATEQSVTWTSSDTNVATVGFDGLVAAQGVGNAVITATTTDGGFTDTATVSVSVTEPIPAATHAGESPTSSSGCVASTLNGGYNGSGYLDFGGNGTWAEWGMIDGGSNGGAATLTFRYANGSGGNRQCSLSVNGATIQNVAFAPSGSWTTWVTVQAVVSLDPGLNAVRLTVNTGSGGPNLDEISVE
ncbi:Ig-like domain-containing protein [Pelagicoccus mobilis]|uniref:Ig-like domain-containing protein n=1 Tax=Pelagicoccus mobilis TaxID=415221 RepID=A0A934S0U5_9BACT|nr:Ig-like domain-containing protein [Pelagicoccus mobilis]MBK1878491.1 Ig-like domain-containing protein [Pelagicoccus mobilis]